MAKSGFVNRDGYEHIGHGRWRLRLGNREVLTTSRIEIPDGNGGKPMMLDIRHELMGGGVQPDDGVIGDGTLGAVRHDPNDATGSSVWNLTL